jgi:hypothetical protein
MAKIRRFLVRLMASANLSPISNTQSREIFIRMCADASEIRGTMCPSGAGSTFENRERRFRIEVRTLKLQECIPCST